MSKLLDLTGSSFGSLRVLGRCENIGPHTAFACECKCGNKVKVRSQSLTKGDTKSCGCARAKAMAEQKTKHGMFYSRPYKSWAAMRQRCSNEKNIGYRYYGGRGISVCEGFTDFSFFIECVGDRPPETSLDRIDNNGNYSCGKCEECKTKNWKLNCRWADAKTQRSNRREPIKRQEI